MNFEKMMSNPITENELDDILLWFEDVHGKETYQYIQVYRLIQALKSK